MKKAFIIFLIAVMSLGTLSGCVPKNLQAKNLYKDTVAKEAENMDKSSARSQKIVDGMKAKSDKQWKEMQGFDANSIKTEYDGKKSAEDIIDGISSKGAHTINFAFFSLLFKLQTSAFWIFLFTVCFGILVILAFRRDKAKQKWGIGIILAGILIPLLITFGPAYYWYIYVGK